MTMISDFPSNLVEEILSRVLLRSMRAVRLTCKKWDTLSKTRRFTKMHIDKISTVKEGESTMVAMIDYNLYLMSVVLVANGDPSLECKGKLTCLDEQVKISKVFQCDGLLLCVLKEEETKVMVWNPYWGQTRSIESRYSHRPGRWDWFSYALGYEDKNSCRSYKFLRFIHKYYHAPNEGKFLWYEIYDFDSGLWKTLDVTAHWRILFGAHGVSLKGNTYWPPSRRNTEDELDDHIICFDFTSESFGPALRLPFDAGDRDSVTLSCVREEKLAVLLTHNVGCPHKLEIWITTKIEAEEVLWSKFLTVQTVYCPLITFRTFFIDEEKKVAMGFEKGCSETFNIIGETGYIKRVGFGERSGRDRSCCAHTCSYVPSLVQVKQPAAGGKRKRESDLEKQRYDQNMSRLLALGN